MSNVNTMKSRYQQAMAEYEERLAVCFISRTGQLMFQKLHPPKVEESKPVEEEMDEDEPMPQQPPEPEKTKKDDDLVQDIMFEEMDFEKLEETPKY